MKVNYDLYKVFDAVAIYGSMSRAADILYISQSAITQAIKSLEDQLGGKLFVRNKNGVTLTEEGQILHEYVRNGIECFSNAENMFLNLKNLDSGKIRIGASTTVAKNVLMPYIEIFHKKYPNIEIQIMNNLTRDLVAQLRSRSLDMLIVNLPMKDTKGLKIEVVKEVQDIFIGNKHFYEQTKDKNLKAEDLKDYPLIFQKAPSNTREFLDKYFEANKLKIIPQNEIVSYSLIMDFVRIGFGIGYATKEFIQNELDSKLLYEIDVEPKVPKRAIGMVTLDKNIPNFSIKKLTEIIKSTKI